MNIPDLLWATAPPWASVTFFLVDLFIRLIALGVVPHNRRPSAAWGWLLVIFFFPLLGALLFAVLGRADLPKSRREKQRAAAKRLDPQDPAVVSTEHEDLPPYVQKAVELNHGNAGFPMVRGNRIEVLDEYGHSLHALAEAIRRAQHYVHLEFYIAVTDDTTEPVIVALEDAHRRGVTVRVLADHLGGVGFPGYKEFVQRMDASGIPWSRMLPVRPWRGEYQRPDLRNHRKIVVVDGRVAFTGSQNLIDRSYNTKANKRKGLQWIDMLLRVEGPLVAHLDAVFATDWYCETDEFIPAGAAVPSRIGPEDGMLCQALPSGTGRDEEANLQLLNHLFTSASQRLTVCTPYFVPEDSMYNALRATARRGVDVRLYMGATSNHRLTHHAQRSFYEMLLKDGIRIFLYTEPYVLHSKFTLVDDEVAVVGSSNMDVRSFALDHEVDLMVVEHEFVARMREVVDSYERDSHELELDVWLTRPWYQKYVDNVARLSAALQ